MMFHPVVSPYLDRRILVILSGNKVGSSIRKLFHNIFNLMKSHGFAGLQQNNR